MRLIKYIALTIFMLSGMLIQTEDYNSFTNQFILFSAFIIFLILVLKKGSNFKIYFKTLDKVFIAFIVTGIFGSILINEMNNLFSILKFFVFYLILVNCQKNDEDYQIYFNSFFLAGIITLIINFYEKTFNNSGNSIAGMFQNPNNYGVFAASIFIYAFCILVQLFIQEQYKKIPIYLMVALYTFYLTASSASRTSFLAIIAAIVVVLFLFLIRLYKINKINQKQFKRFLISFYVSIFILIIILNSGLMETIDENIISKFLQRGSNVYSGRPEIWSFYLSNSTMFGTPENSIGNLIGYSAHNSFIYMISQFGFVSGIIFILFWVIALYQGIIYFIQKVDKDPNAILMVASLVTFIAISMMEIVTNTSIMYLAFLCIGYMSNNSLRIPKDN